MFQTNKKNPSDLKPTIGFSQICVFFSLKFYILMFFWCQLSSLLLIIIAKAEPWFGKVMKGSNRIFYVPHLSNHIFGIFSSSSFHTLEKKARNFEYKIYHNHVAIESYIKYEILKEAGMCNLEKRGVRTQCNWNVLNKELEAFVYVQYIESCNQTELGSSFNSPPLSIVALTRSF